MASSEVLRTLHQDRITSVAFNWHGDRVASSSLDHTLTVAQYTAGARSSSSGAGGPAAAAAAATANTGAAGGGGGGGGATWDAHRPHQHWRAHDAPILRVAWAHPEFGSVLASCAVDGLVKVWAEEQTPRSGATTGTTATAQGQQAGSQGQSHGSTGAGVTTQQQQQHTSRWVCKATLTDPRGTARAVEFAPPSFGLKLACISSDSHLRVWACVDPLALADWSLIEDVPLASLSPQPFGFPPSLGGGAGGGAGAQGQQGQGQQGGANPSATGSGGSSVTQLPPTQSGMSTPGLSGVPGESPMGSLTSPASALQGRNFDFNNPGSLSSGGGSGSRPFLPSSGNTGSFAGSDANLAQQQQQAQMPLAHAGAIESDGGWALSWCSESWWGERIAVSAGTSGVIRLLHLRPHQPYVNFLTIPSSSSSSAQQQSTAPVSSLAWSPASGRDYQLLAAGSRDGRARVWKVWTGAPTSSQPASSFDKQGRNGGGGARMNEDEEGGAGSKRMSLAAAGGAGMDDEDWRAEETPDMDERVSDGAGDVKVEWNLTGTVLSTAGDDGKVRLWKCTYTGSWRPIAVLSTEDSAEDDAMQS